MEGIEGEVTATSTNSLVNPKKGTLEPMKTDTLARPTDVDDALYLHLNPMMMMVMYLCVCVCLYVVIFLTLFHITSCASNDAS